MAEKQAKINGTHRRSGYDAGLRDPAERFFCATTGFCDERKSDLARLALFTATTSVLRGEALSPFRRRRHGVPLEKL